MGSNAYTVTRERSAFREGHRHDDNATQVTNVTRLALAARPSVDFCGYWQRAAA